MNKKLIVLTIVLAVFLVGIYVWTKSANDLAGTPQESFDPTSSPEPSATVSSSVKPTPSKSLTVTKIPLPTGNGGISSVGEQTPWNLLLADASCELKGEIKFLNHNTYDNQDGLFVYKGIDSPGRNIFWAISPQDDLSVGPNIFNKISIPDGESLLGVALPENPKYKKYELTARIQYGRLVDEKGKFVATGGNVKVFEKACTGKTTVVLP